MPVGHWWDILRARFVDPKIRQAAAGGEDIADVDNVVRGVKRGDGCCEQFAASRAELGRAIALSEDSSEGSFISRHVAERRGIPNHGGSFVHACRLFAQLDVQRAQPASSRGAAREEQLRNTGGLRIGDVRMMNARRDRVELRHSLA